MLWAVCPRTLSTTCVTCVIAKITPRSHVSRLMPHTGHSQHPSYLGYLVLAFFNPCSPGINCLQQMPLGPLHQGKSLASNALSNTLEYHDQTPPLSEYKASRASQTPWCISALTCGEHSLYSTAWMHFHSVCKHTEYLALPQAWRLVLGPTFLLGGVHHQALLFPPSVRVNYFAWYQPLVVYGPKCFPPSRFPY